MSWLSILLGLPVNAVVGPDHCICAIKYYMACPIRHVHLPAAFLQGSGLQFKRGLYFHCIVTKQAEQLQSRTQCALVCLSVAKCRLHIEQRYWLIPSVCRSFSRTAVEYPRETHPCTSLIICSILSAKNLCIYVNRGSAAWSMHTLLWISLLYCSAAAAECLCQQKHYC